jgi:hypothetical protein
MIGAPAATAKKKKKVKKPVTQTITFEQEGTVRAPAPTSLALFGVTDGEFIAVHECGQMPATQGHDAYIVEIPAEFQTGTGTLQVAGSDATGAHDFDVYLYDASCSLMEPYITEGADPTGVILPGAKWAVVSLFTGANASFKLTGTATVTL